MRLEAGWPMARSAAWGSSSWRTTSTSTPPIRPRRSSAAGCCSGIHVGIGTDSEATAKAYLQELRATLHARYAATGGTFRERCPDGRVAGLADGMVGWPRITQRLLARGFSAEDVHKVNGGNLLRVFREAWRPPAG
jgi:hypothetical protein